MRGTRHVELGVAALVGIIVVGTLGYVVLGFAPLDALYQTVTTITTVGFREVEPLDEVGQVFTIVLILAGVGTALYTLSAGLELLVEGHIGHEIERRRMDKRIAAAHDHVIVCGWGRVGRAVADDLATTSTAVVVVDNDPERVATVPPSYAALFGDAADDDVLRRAGIERARALVAAVSTDAVNLFITMSARALRPELFIVARAREESNEAKLATVGADRVVNPQELGGARIAAFVVRPRVTEFLDVVMHSGGGDLLLEDVTLADDSPLVGQSLRAAQVRDRTGALVLAVHDPVKGFDHNPSADTVMRPGQTLIAIGLPAQLDALNAAAAHHVAR